MSTKFRTQLSKKNKYCIDKERRLELVHFCLQYKMWKKEILSFEDKFEHGIIYEKETPEDIAMLKRRYESYKKSVEMVECAAVETDPDLASYILKAVTEGLSFKNLEMMSDIPCSKSTYVRRYHKFFWILDEKRL